MVSVGESERPRVGPAGPGVAGRSLAATPMPIAAPDKRVVCPVIAVSVYMSFSEIVRDFMYGNGHMRWSKRFVSSFYMFLMMCDAKDHVCRAMGGHPYQWLV